MASLAQQYGGAPNNAKAATVSSAIDEFDPVINRVEDCLVRLNKLHDRVHGSRPAELTGEAAPAPSPHSLIDAVQRRRIRLAGLTDEIERVLLNIEGGI